MLISIESSQGCGKTTLINELKKLNYQIVDKQISRSILSDWKVTLDEVNDNHKLTIPFQNEVILRKYGWERHHIDSNDFVFTERSYASVFTYALISLGKNNEFSNWIDEYYEECRRYHQDYTCVFYLTGGHFKIQHDGVRGSNKHYGKMVDIVMFDILKQMTDKSKLCIIDVADLQKRIETIQNQLGNIKTFGTK